MLAALLRATMSAAQPLCFSAKTHQRENRRLVIVPFDSMNIPEARATTQDVYCFFTWLVEMLDNTALTLHNVEDLARLITF